MAKEESIEKEETQSCLNVKKCCKGKNTGCGSAGAFYGLGFIGALVYFIQHSQSFVDGLYGVLKAIVWPALVIYKVLEFFKF